MIQRPASDTSAPIAGIVMCYDDMIEVQQVIPPM